MTEVRIHAEGSLWWVQASGSGRAWATASAPQSGLFAYCESFSITSAQSLKQIMNRGVPDHHKVTEKTPVAAKMTVLWTGYVPQAASGSGASVPMMHWEYRANEPENGNSGRYTQLHGVANNSWQLTEAKDGNTLQLDAVALAMNGPTASGFLSNAFAS
jgi:hypothetical protein